MNKMTFAALAGLVLVGLAAVRPAAAATSGIDEKKIEEITAAVAPSVVRVEARNGIYKVATGVVIDADGSIVTTALISPRDEKITIVTMDGKSHKAEFKGFDTETGIAVVQVKEAKLRPIAVGKSAGLKTGSWIGVVGLSPLDRRRRSFSRADAVRHPGDHQLHDRGEPPAERLDRPRFERQPGRQRRRPDDRRPPRGLYGRAADRFRVPGETGRGLGNGLQPGRDSVVGHGRRRARRYRQRGLRGDPEERQGQPRLAWRFHDGGRRPGSAAAGSAFP